MKNFNMTEWALKHKELVLFFIVIVFIGGIFSYQRLGRMEDPDFTIRQMVVNVYWPGASARQVEEQVTDKIEKKLQDTPGLDYLKSYSRPGVAVIFVTLKDDAVVDSQIRPTWLEVRNMVNDIKGTLPSGVQGPFFNDRFDDVFGCVYALTGDGYTYEELREQAETIRRTLLSVANVKKVDLVGVQPEKIYIEIESGKLAQLGIPPAAITNAVSAQNAMTPSGMLETTSDNVYLRVSGIFESMDDLRSLPICADGRTFRLGDIARIERSYEEPAEPKMLFNGRPAIGIALSMEKGGNILSLGENLEHTIAVIQKNLPLGLEINEVANQPEVVKESIGEFTKSLGEAVAIVLLISLLSLGVRSGLVVALCIPLVLAAVFVCMAIAGIDLHKISLGALIISLGLLVDDAIIAIEMMIVKLEQGWSRFDAACHAYTVTAFPMLSGTLITCAGFIPVGFSKGSASEFVGSLFSVITISLVISWFVSVLVTPLLGYYFVKQPPVHSTSGHEIYNTRFYVLFRNILSWCLTHRKKVIIATLVCFIGSIVLLGLVKQEFFPASNRPEIVADLRLPEGSSLKATEQVAARLAKHYEGDPNIVNYSYYVGQGAPRFVLTLDPTLPDKSFAQFIVVGKDLKARNELISKTNQLLATEFPEVQGNVRGIQTGPSSPYPVMLRVEGPNHEQVRKIASQVRERMAADPNLVDINQDWNEKSKVMHLRINQDKARVLGLDSSTLSGNLQAMISGMTIAEFREKDKTIGIVFRVDSQNRNDLAQIKNLNVHIGNGKYVPLDQIAKISYEAEEGLIWRRDLKPTITIQANTIPGVLGNSATFDLYDKLKDIRDKLPPGYSIELDGPTESSEKAVVWLMQPVPVMLISILILLMFQLESVSKTILVLLTAPLGVIGASLGLLATGKSMGFVVQLGLLALAGIIMRNSVILIDQIEQHIKAGEHPWDAIINAAVTRFRPIMLTAAAAILGMVPLISSVFWGPMAVAIAGGLFGATILTLLVLPSMYAAWYKVQPVEKSSLNEPD